MTRYATAGSVLTGAVLSIQLLSVNLVAQPLERKLVPFDGAEEDRCGLSVAVSGDFLIVGSPQDDDNGMNSGSAYLFRWDGADWSQDSKLSASGGASQDLFGSAVDVSGDRAIVGAPGDGPDRGAAYVFHFDGSAWTEEAVLIPSDGSGGDFFGASVGLEGTFAVVGAYGHQSAAGAAYVFRHVGATWIEVAKLVASDRAPADYFGISAAISGNYAIIGAWWDDDNGLNSGSAYVFRGDGAVWTEEAKLLPADGAMDDFFGFSVALSGMFALVGAYGGDDDGNFSGSAYVFRRSGSDWVQQDKLRASDAAPSDFFGYAVDIFADSAIVGSPFDDDRGGSSGSAYLYGLDGTDWRQSRKLVASDGSEGDHFGQSVVVGDGYAVAGAPDDDVAGPNSGSVYVYAGGVTSVSDASDTKPEDLVLLQNYPNPFNAETRITYTLRSAEPVILRVYDPLGREVATLVNENKVAGKHSVIWDAPGLPSGVYVYRFQAAGRTWIRKMVLVK